MVGKVPAGAPVGLALGSFGMDMHATLRWRAAVLAAVAAVVFSSFGLVGCTDETPAQNPGTEQDDGNGDQDDDGY